MQIENRNIADLLPYPNNAKTHSDEQIAKIAASIKEFGFNNPVLIDKDGGIIAGHGRVDAARKLNLTELPTIKLGHLTEAQKKAYILADNRLAEIGSEWDLDLVSIELDQIAELGLDIDLTGFDDSWLQIDEVEGLTDEDEVPEAPEIPVSTEGDLWLLGNHRLLCGDATSIDAVERLMKGEKADQYVTDPPYNVDYTGKAKAALKISNDEMSDVAFRQFLKDSFVAADNAMKQGAVFYIWHADSEGYNFRGACHDVGWTVRQCLIWNKNTMVFGRQDYHWKHEPCLYGWKNGAGHLWASDRTQVTVMNFDRRNKNIEHPTMKPVEIMEYQIKNNTKGSDIVLDTFGGSGSTLIACEKTNRNCRMMELDPKYIDVIITRWQNFTGKEAVHESGTTFNEMKAQREAA